MCEILPMQYVASEPLLEVPAFALNIYENGKTPAQIFPLTGPQEWRKQRTALRQMRYDEQGLDRTEYVGGHFSGASGGTLYNGDAWPEEYQRAGRQSLLPRYLPLRSRLTVMH
jgi:hypothetical protein